MFLACNVNHSLSGPSAIYSSELFLIQLIFCRVTLKLPLCFCLPLLEVLADTGMLWYLSDTNEPLAATLTFLLILSLFLTPVHRWKCWHFISLDYYKRKLKLLLDCRKVWILVSSFFVTVHILAELCCFFCLLFLLNHAEPYFFTFCTFLF